MHCSLYFLLLFLLNTSVCHIAHWLGNKSSENRVCTFREDVGTGTPPQKEKSTEPMNVLVSEWRRGIEILPLLNEGDLMEVELDTGNHWMIYVGGENLEYIEACVANNFSVNTASVQKGSLKKSCRRRMIRKNNELDAEYEQYSPAQVVQRAQDLLGCTGIPFSYSRNNCQHFVNSVRYDIWQSKIGDQRNSCQRNTKPWRRVVERKFPAISGPLHKPSRSSNSGKQVLLKIKFYGNLPEDIHSAYWPLVNLVRAEGSKNGTLKSVKVEFDQNKITNKNLGQLLAFVKERTEEYHAETLENLEQEDKRVVLHALVLREWNALVKQLYSKVLSSSHTTDQPIHANNGGAIECYRDWDLDYTNQLLNKLISQHVKDLDARQRLTSSKHMIQYKINVSKLQKFQNFFY